MKYWQDNGYINGRTKRKIACAAILYLIVCTAYDMGASLPNPDNKKSENRQQEESQEQVGALGTHDTHNNQPDISKVDTPATSDKSSSRPRTRSVYKTVNNIKRAITVRLKNCGIKKPVLVISGALGTICAMRWVFNNYITPVSIKQDQENNGDGAVGSPIGASGNNGQKAQAGCTFCDIACGRERAKKEYARDSNAFAIQSLSGKLLTIPTVHITSLKDLNDGNISYIADIFRLAAQVTRDYFSPLFTEKFYQEAYFHTGARAGQTQPHVHLHVSLEKGKVASQVQQVNDLVKLAQDNALHYISPDMITLAHIYS